MLAALVGLTSLVKLSFEHRIFRHQAGEEPSAQTPLNKTARLLTNELGVVARVRILCGIGGGMVLPLLLVLDRAPGEAPVPGLALMAFVFCLAGELLERYLFFTAVAPVKMPGGVSA